MIQINLKQLTDILSGELHGNPELVVEEVTTDTRKTCINGLFFALKGQRFDAHEYLEQAQKQGAVAAIVEKLNPELSLTQIIVKDTRLALGKLGQWLHAELSPTTLAITGSSGKTTVKEMLAAILSVKGEVLYTQGNFNNDIGVPLTLLRLTPKHTYAVIELGANHAGEIAYTTMLTRPDVAMVNNVAEAHLEGFGSLEGVAKAKGEIYRGLSKQGIAIINLDSNGLPAWRDEIKDHQSLTFSQTNPNADIYASDIQCHDDMTSFMMHTEQGDIRLNIPYLGQHNVTNALAAALMSLTVGATLNEIQRGLAIKHNVSGRLYPIRVSDNLLLLDDSYNANMASMRSAINVLKQYSAKRIFVVGDMAELGDNSALLHQELAQDVANASLEHVVSYGVQSRVISEKANGHHFEDKKMLITFLESLLQQSMKYNKKVVLLTKGSRGMKMEEVIHALQEFKG